MSPSAGPTGRRSGHFLIKIPSRLEEIDAVCGMARDLLIRRDAANKLFAIDLLLREALTNAIGHGNRSDPQKLVTIELRIGRKWIRMRVSDEGPGFSWRSASTLPPADTEVSCRGLAIGALYAQRVRFNTAGNQIEYWIEKASQ